MVTLRQGAHAGACKTVVEEPAESNPPVTTVRGQRVSFVLRSEGAAAKPVDFVLTYKPVGTFLVAIDRDRDSSASSAIGG